jgi:methyl-accepting chemotaxis protein
MKLRAKFNLMIVAVFGLGAVITGMVSYRLLENNAKAETMRKAALMMETAIAIRGYTVKHVRPNLEKLQTAEFLPQTVPAFAATETLAVLTRNERDYTGYRYKEATLNPTNPRDKAQPWEVEVVTMFRADPGRRLIEGERDFDGQQVMYIARPIMITDGACLACHGEPTAAPAAMLAKYGASGGFGWKLNEIVGAQVVTVPTAVPIAAARETFVAFMVGLAIVFVLLGIAMNVMLTTTIVQPLTRMSASADKFSMGDFSEPELPARGDDEVGVLGTSFNRLRRSLEQAFKIIQKRQGGR